MLNDRDFLWFMVILIGIGVGIGAGLFIGLPALWELAKPWLHALTA